MSTNDNIKTVQSIYEAFGRGDVGTILDAVDDTNIDWASDTSSTVAPWYGVRKSKTEIEKFFEAVGTTMEVEEFTPKTFGGTDTEVFALVYFRAKARATGKTVAMNLHHYWVFNPAGKITYYRGTEDTAQTEAALKA